VNYKLHAATCRSDQTDSKGIKTHLINAATPVTAVPFTHSKTTRSSAVIADRPRDTACFFVAKCLSTYKI